MVGQAAVGVLMTRAALNSTTTSEIPLTNPTMFARVLYRSPVTVN